MQVSNERVWLVTNNIRPLNAVWSCSFEYGAYLVQSAYICLGQNECLVREATFPTLKKSVSLRMVLIWDHIAFYRSIPGLITCESLFAVTLIILVRQWLQGKSSVWVPFVLLLNNMEYLIKLQLQSLLVKTTWFWICAHSVVGQR